MVRDISPFLNATVRSVIDRSIYFLILHKTGMKVVGPKTTRRSKPFDFVENCAS